MTGDSPDDRRQLGLIMEGFSTPRSPIVWEKQGNAFRIRHLAADWRARETGVVNLQSEARGTDAMPWPALAM